jgi:hypothetical protein
MKLRKRPNRRKMIKTETSNAFLAVNNFQVEKVFIYTIGNVITKMKKFHAKGANENSQLRKDWKITNV